MSAGRTWKRAGAGRADLYDDGRGGGGAAFCRDAIRQIGGDHRRSEAEAGGRGPHPGVGGGGAGYRGEQRRHRKWRFQQKQKAVVVFRGYWAARAAVDPRPHSAGKGRLADHGVHLWGQAAQRPEDGLRRAAGGGETDDCPAREADHPGIRGGAGHRTWFTTYT